MKYLILLLKIIFPIAILLIVFQYTAYDVRWYKNEFFKQGIYNQLGETRVNDQADNLFKYLRKKKLLEEKYYSQKEILHLKDVKSILYITRHTTWILVILYLVIFLVIAIKKGITECLKIVYKCFIINIITYSIFIIIALVLFTQIFYIFHRLLFVNNYWLLDPQIEYLVVIFPQDLFLDLFVKIIIYSFAVSFVGAITLKIFALKKSQTYI